MIIKLCIPSILPYKLSMSSFSPYPIREVYVELILLQFVIPTLIEHGNFRVALKAVVQAWAYSAAKLMYVIGRWFVVIIYLFLFFFVLKN